MSACNRIFPALDDNPESALTEIDSLCMGCFKTGKTKMLLTKIPFYKEVVIVSFSCDHCGLQNNEIQSGAEILEKGIRLTLSVRTKEDLNRQVVTSDHSGIKIPEVDFEIPPKSRKGEITTIEGIVRKTIAGLEQDQTRRRIEHPEDALKIDEFIKKLLNLLDLQAPFTVIVEDITGNAFIENPNAPEVDPNCKEVHLTRTKEQDHELGIYSKTEIGEKQEDRQSNILHPVSEDDFNLEDLQGEVLKFVTNCPNCGSSSCNTNMKMTKIPHFKEVVIMATTCDDCGHRTNEVKSGGGIEPKGIKIEVTIANRDDFSRDILKSETCSVTIPELNLEVGPYALGGRFTTTEGLLVAMKDQLKDPKHTQMFGDSQTGDAKRRLEEFYEKLDDVLEGKIRITLVLDDPAGNSYVQSMRDDDTPDDAMKVTYYDRTFEQNEELGLNDMKTENY